LKFFTDHHLAFSLIHYHHHHSKSKRVTKKGKAKKQIEPFSKKTWFDVRAPAPFSGKVFTKTPINKSAGTRIASEALKGRVFETSVGDLTQDMSLSHVVMKLRVDDVRGKNAYTTFHGMRFSTDKLRSLLKKWHTLVRTQVDCKTMDGYTIRMFAVSFTRRRQLQLSKTTYAQKSQVIRMVTRMREIMTKAAAGNEMKELTTAIIHGGISKEMEKACAGIFPLSNTFIYQVKTLKRPKIDPAKIATLYKEYSVEPQAEEAEEPVAAPAAETA
jgi:small subunit ribosomal protein S3Ae